MLNLKYFSRVNLKYIYNFNTHLEYSFIWPHRVLAAACRSYFPGQGLNPGPPAVKVQSLSHQTPREVPNTCILELQKGTILPSQ